MRTLDEELCRLSKKLVVDFRTLRYSLSAFRTSILHPWLLIPGIFV